MQTGSIFWKSETILHINYFLHVAYVSWNCI